MVSHRIADVEIQCPPKDLPESLELDLSQMGLNESKSLSDIPLPAGVAITALVQGKDQVVVSIHSPRAAEPEPVVEGAVAGAAAAPAAAAGADAKKGEPSKKAEPAKKETAKK